MPEQQAEKLRGRGVAHGLRIIAGLVLLVAGSAMGQQRYQLEDDQWLQQTHVDPDSPAGQIQTIRKALAEDRPHQAKKLTTQWLKEHRDHPLSVEAYLLRGDAQLARGHDYKALDDYEYVIRQYPAAEQFHTAVQREYQIAELYAGGLKRRLLGLRILPAGGEAEQLFILIQERAPGTEMGEKASLALGDYYFKRREFDSAADAYDLFLTNYPRSDRRQQAMLRLIQSDLGQFRGPRYDPTGLLQAAEHLRRYRLQFPAAAEQLGADKMLADIEQSLALKQLNSARWYERRRKRISAVYLYKRVIKDHPTTAAAQSALERLTALGELDRPPVEHSAASEGSSP